MKKNWFVYFGIFIGILFIFLSWGLKSDFMVEKNVAKVYSRFENLAKDTTGVPGQTYESIIKDYYTILKQHPKSPATQTVPLLIGKVYILQKDYETARRVLEQVAVKQADNPELAAEAVSMIAKTYELEDHWPKAKATYERIIKDYALTGVGLSTPVYVANYYQGKNDFNETMEAYNQAIDFYRQVAEAHSNSTIEFDALRFLANCYFAQNRWLEGVQTLGQILMKYPSSNHLTIQRANLIIKTINAAAITQLKDPDVAIHIYQKFMDAYPEHPMNKALVSVIESLNNAKENEKGSALQNIPQH